MCININLYILGFRGGRLYIFGGINRGGNDVNGPIYLNLGICSCIGTQGLTIIGFGGKF